MIWLDVIKIHGEKIANKISKSKWLNGITVSIIKCPYCNGSCRIKKLIKVIPVTKKNYFFTRFVNCPACKGKGVCTDIPETDIERAYKDTMGFKIKVGEWD